MGGVDAFCRINLAYEKYKYREKMLFAYINRKIPNNRILFSKHWPDYHFLLLWLCGDISTCQSQSFKHEEMCVATARTCLTLICFFFFLIKIRRLGVYVQLLNDLLVQLIEKDSSRRLMLRAKKKH